MGRGSQFQLMRPFSILFWYMGMIPDLAVIRDRAKQRWRKIFYGILSMGWRHANNHWRNFEMAYLILAGLSTLWFSPFIPSFPSILRLPTSLAGTPPSFHLILLQAPFSRDSGWYSPCFFPSDQSSGCTT